MWAQGERGSATVGGSARSGPCCSQLWAPLPALTPASPMGFLPHIPGWVWAGSSGIYRALINVPALLGSWLFTQFSVIVKLSSFILLTEKSYLSAFGYVTGFCSVLAR